MDIFTEISSIKAFLKDVRSIDKSIGLVPTMGALHKGHLALIEASRRENEFTVCSIYINPAQFNNPADLSNYPRTMDMDTDLLKKVGCDALFCPKNNEMYPHEPRLRFDFGELDKVLEGEFRPGHFSGVALIVSKLLHIVDPDRAYFGQKDWQQFCIIRQLVEDLKFNCELISVPTIREANGLAQSSRNLRLSAGELEIASILYESLHMAKTAIKKGYDLNVIKGEVAARFQKQEGVRLEYFEIADSKNLTLLNRVEESDRPILCIAGYIGEVRLIDNMFLDL